MSDYDEKTITEFALKLLTKADLTVVLFGVLGLFSGSIAYLLINAAGPNLSGFAGFAGVVILAVCMIIAMGRAQALRVQAQTLLCQVQIERNTRAMASYLYHWLNPAQSTSVDLE
ncbi:MAG TPA: hypothetical protein PLX20_15290 [Rhodocyclaceae bacterium]|jgi:hypothetical protein|nr:hypothetical protein [Rhodocyclaceae bacterium]HMV54505.1 hypothetical protein [Rhodocyclaceae bacterium]HNH14501.1 hypothetical protein [Rhodocyclaceae bacterium]